MNARCTNSTSALLIAALTLLSATWAGAADRALLVGIDDYKHARVPGTPGALADANAMSRVLTQAYGFEKKDIKLLTGPSATAENILKQFQEWLVDGSSPGDRVFFYYAGHGSQLEDDNGDEDDGWDETLAPYDVVPGSGDNQIRDDMMDAKISSLSGRRAVLLFDSCHSGTITRGIPQDQDLLEGGGARYLPRPDQFRDIEDGTSSVQMRGKKAYSVAPTAGGPGGRPFDGPSSVGGLSGIVVLSAAGPGQLAYPVEVDGGYRGAFTYLFEQYHLGRGDGSRSIFDDLKGAAIGAAGGAAVSAATGSTDDLADTAIDAMSVAAIGSAMNKGMEKLRKDGKLMGNQQAFYEVISEVPLEERPLFGDWNEAAVVALNNPVVDRTVRIDTESGGRQFDEGEDLSFVVESSHAGFLYLFVFSEGQRATCVFPNPSDMNNEIRAGTFVLPGEREYRFPVQAPFGRDVVTALVSDQAMAICDRVEYTWSELFDRLRLDEIQDRVLALSMRGVGVAPKESPQDDIVTDNAHQWQADSVVIETRP